MSKIIRDRSSNFSERMIEVLHVHLPHGGQLWRCDERRRTDLDVFRSPGREMPAQRFHRRTDNCELNVSLAQEEENDATYGLVTWPS